MNQPIQAILNEIADGNEHAFAQMYKHYFKSSFNIARYITKSQYLAEEAISDVFASVWKERQRLSNITDWDSYLYIMVRNRSFYYRKKSQQINTYSLDDLTYSVNFEDSESPLDQLQLKELRKKVDEELNELTEKMKLVFFLVKEQGVSHKEIAKQLNLSERTINAHITEASKRLREAIQKFLGS